MTVNLSLTKCLNVTRLNVYTLRMCKVQKALISGSLVQRPRRYKSVWTKNYYLISSTWTLAFEINFLSHVGWKFIYWNCYFLRNKKRGNIFILKGGNDFFYFREEWLFFYFRKEWVFFWGQRKVLIKKEWKAGPPFHSVGVVIVQITIAASETGNSFIDVFEYGRGIVLLHRHRRSWREFVRRRAGMRHTWTTPTSKSLPQGSAFGLTTWACLAGMSTITHVHSA